MRLALALALTATAVTTAAAATPPRVQPVSIPRTAVVGNAWRAVISIRPAAKATLEARGPETIRARFLRTGKAGRYAATLRFPHPGRFALCASAGGRSTGLGSVDVDILRDPLLLDPIALAAEPGGALIVGQLREGALLRLTDGRATSISGDFPVFHVAVAGGKAYAAAHDGAVYRVDGSSLTRISPAMDASSVAVDEQGNLYVTVYVGWIKKVAPDGTVTTLAGDGNEGFAGDGGPAIAAKLFHPHAVVIGRDGALYVADTENRRIRRIDLTAGTITTFGGDVGITTSLAAAPDGSIYSSDVVRNGAGGGIVRVAADGSTTTRILSHPNISSVAVAPDGTVYANAWESKRILRVNPATRKTETIARG